MTSEVIKGFVAVGARDVHYRRAGSGPLVVLLHDSPRSSALHFPLLRALSDTFTVIALDTPGYGGSTPLTASSFEIKDFSTALAQTLDALGIASAAFYGTHTSSKILLQLTLDYPERVSVAIMDGLSLPEGGPDPVYIDRYMRPFVIDDEGAYIAREWSRHRDSGRWFPWFSRTPETRFATSPPTPSDAHHSLLDYFTAGPHYTDAYRAAMFYRALDALPQITAPSYILARTDDVLYSHLDRVPADLPGPVTVERLSADRNAWSDRVKMIFRAHTPRASAAVAPPSQRLEPGHCAYLSMSHGQVCVRQLGGGVKRPIVYLADLPGGAAASTELLAALAADRPVFALDLPGCGRSDPLPAPTLAAYVEVLQASIDALAVGPVDLVAEYMATPIALRALADSPERFSQAVLDGLLLADIATRTELRARYCPRLQYDAAGAYLHQVWHMLRDQQIHWPWYDGSVQAARWGSLNLDAESLHLRFLDVLNQLEDYGDACLAALESDAEADLARIARRLLVTVNEDPRHQWAAGAARASSFVLSCERQPGSGLRAEQFRLFFDQPQSAPAS